MIIHPRTNKTIFFSWQSDLPSDANHYAIKGSIEKAIKETDLSYDEATRNTSGSINILEKIYEKISVADIFVCDITTVGKIQNTNASKRPTPNPNVLLELGYAIAHLGWERIILVYNEKFADKNSSNYSDLPFDISKHRLTKYTVNDNDDKVGKDKLTESLKSAVKTILQNKSVTNGTIIRSVREGKREKDVENLTWLLKRISLKAFDTFRDNLPEKMYMPVVNFFAECINYCHNNSLFHIHNQELKMLIDEFCHSL
ncbi:MAG: nucleotide-binding protein [Planctomycetaceae bacterium]|jgi:hypothetical protein|nr:nucleotide-binding protein [Planctomycetaceae bacterium]